MDMLRAEDPAWMLSTAAILVVTTIILMIKFRRHPDNIPIVSGGLPFFGHAFTMVKGSPWDTMAAWVATYGMIYRVFLFGSSAIAIADPKLLKIVLSTKLSVFKKDKKWTYKPFMVLLGNGLVTADGHSWRRQRTLLASYLKISILQSIPAMALGAVQRLCVQLDAAKKDGTVVEMAEVFRRLTLQVIAEAVLSLSPEESDNTFAQMYLPIVEEGNLRIWQPHRMYIPSPSWIKYSNDVKRLNDYVLGLIYARRKLRAEEAQNASSGKGSYTRTQDVLDISLSAYSDEEWGPEAASQIRDEIKTFILAGHETSASMLAWSLYEISKKSGSSIREKVQNEAKKVFQGHLVPASDCENSAVTRKSIKTLPSFEVINELQYSECCLRESLRKYSVVPTVVRIADEEVELDGGYLIRKGSTVFVNIQGVHHNPSIWPEPLTYRPERFEEPIAPYSFLPFIEGPRTCIGQYLSLLETKIVLALLVSMYEFEIVNPEDAGLKHSYMVPIIPKTGHFMKIH